MMLPIDAQIKNAMLAFNKFKKEKNTKITQAITEVCLMCERDAKLMFRSRTEESWNGSPPRVQTNRARASITHRITTDFAGNPVGEFGSNVEYFADLELGTSYTWPHPTLVPALEKNREEGIRKIADAVKESANA